MSCGFHIGFKSKAGPVKMVHRSSVIRILPSFSRKSRQCMVGQNRSSICLVKETFAGI
ncbi:unnamed protein product [Timema podura]|uniref:Uncharacterized protein n=1 Tax=Timema podura TaxID=61482 RepID=A0ABN7PUQ4_TIMPD|nr:unnamed protein product [Timema podura]